MDFCLGYISGRRRMSSGTLKRDSCHSSFIHEHLTVENKNSTTTVNTNALVIIGRLTQQPVMEMI